MKTFRKFTALALSAAMALSLCACGASSTSSAASSSTASASASSSDGYTEDTAALTLSSSKWQYDSDNDVYWQIGVAYCSDPAAADYETMGIYVPGAYFTGTANSDGTYTCTVNESGKVGDYTAATAPVVFPVNTPGYTGQAAPTSYSYSGLSSYLSAGLIYCYAGMRGRDNGYDSTGALSYSGGAPWGVTDLKAAVRYYRFNDSVLPGDDEKVFTFGHSGGGAQSALMGSTGDSALYTPYLESIGAAMTDASGAAISDAVCGAMCWCPITTLDYADAAYEWNMGQYATTGTRADGTFTAQLSDDLANLYATYLNQLGLKDENGNALTLTQSSSGIYTSGSYYDYMVQVVETSLNNFLSDTTFPYTPNNTTQASGNFAGGGSTDTGTSGSAPSGLSGSMPSGTMPSGSAPTGMGGGMTASGTDSSSSATYDTVEDYIASLNSDETWVTYDSATNTATITSMEAFVTHCKNATKDVGAFDALDRSQAENNEFGNDDSDSLHFDAALSGLLSANSSAYSALSNWDSSYPTAYAGDLTLTDALGTSVTDRVNMYNPMYFLCSCYAGAGTSTVAPYWRIRTGIDQGDTALTTETNLALALEADSSVKSVDFATVWGLGHTTAERTGDSTTNFIAWVAECVQ